MDFSFTPEQERIRDAIAKLCERFDSDYWLAHDKSGEFPREFQQACARDGWLGIAMPEAYGGAGPGSREAAGGVDGRPRLRAGVLGGASRADENILLLTRVG